MSRDWLTDRLPEIPEEELRAIHEYMDNKGKNVIRGPTTITGPNGKLISLGVDEEVEILGGIVYRTFLRGMPPIDDMKLRTENKVLLDIRWQDNWEKDGFTLEVRRPQSHRGVVDVCGARLPFAESPSV
jgi:hypothetical protein